MPKKDKKVRKPKPIKPRKKKLDIKAAKEPDQFIDYTRKLFDWLRDHQKQVIIGIAGLLGLIVVVSTWQYFSKRSANKAGHSYSKALAASAVPVTELATKQQLKRIPKDVKVYKTVKERNTELVKLLGEVVANHNGSRASHLAKMSLAALSLSGIKSKNVEANLKAFIEEYKDSPLRWIAAENLGFHYEKAGKTSSAAAQYEKLVKSTIVHYQVTGNVHLGDLYTKTNPKKAAAYFKKVLRNKSFASYLQGQAIVRQVVQKKYDLLEDK